MWHDLWPWLLAFLVLCLTLAALWIALRRPRTRTADNLHDRAIDLWLAGDLPAARDLMREVVRSDPGRSRPYLQLGILLRRTGDPGRAVALHRSLSVRADLPREQRVAVCLELAEDLLALSRPEEAQEVLLQLGPHAADQERWYRLRFAAAIAKNRPEEALDALREGEKSLPQELSERLRALRAAWLTDRALRHVRSGQRDEAMRYMHQARRLPEAAARVLLLRALLAANEGDDDGTVSAAAEGLAKYPAEMAPALPLLESALLATGRFAMAVPILEEACRDMTAPPQLWMALVHLYDKLGRRDDAMNLLQSKSQDPRMTPNTAASYLRHLAAEAPDTAIGRVWSMLRAPDSEHGFRCGQCGHRNKDLQWFCANCLSPDSFVPDSAADQVVRPEEHVPSVSPPRY